MTEVLTKAKYAARLSVKASAVSNWIKRGKLTAPALRADGTVDVELADRQLSVTVETLRKVSRPAPAAQAELVDFGAAGALLRSRATMAEIACERARRQLNADVGRYCVTADAQAAWGNALSDWLIGVEASFAGLAYDLRLEQGQLVELRRWWRQQRAEGAERNRVAAAAEPEFTSDPEVA